MATNDTLEAAEQAPMGQLGIQKLYVKDLSFEAPNAPKIFTEQLSPSLDVQLANAAVTLAENVEATRATARLEAFIP